MADTVTRKPANRVQRVTRIVPPVHPRLARLRRLGWVLDRSIPIGRYRIGLDPLLGLLPGFGDTVAAAFSILIIFDAARLGLPVNVLLRMLGNVLVDTLVGAVPLLGDLFDFAWQANARNLRLVEKHYDPLRAERPTRRITTALGVLAGIAVIGMLVLGFLVLQALWRLVSNASIF